MVPQLVESFLWSMGHATVKALDTLECQRSDDTNGSFQRSFANFTSIPQAQSALCTGPESSTWWSQVNSPTLTEANRFSMRNTICWGLENWRAIQADIEKELMLTNLTSFNANTGKLLSDLNELVAVWDRFGPQKPRLIVSGNDEWIQPRTYELIFERWRESRGSMEQISSELKMFLDSGQLDRVPHFGDVSRAVKKLVTSMTNKRFSYRLRDDLKKLEEVGKRILESEGDLKAAVAYMLEKLPWPEVEALPELADAMISFVESIAGRNAGARTVRPYLSAVKVVLEYLNDYGRMMPSKSAMVTRLNPFLKSFQQASETDAKKNGAAGNRTRIGRAPYRSGTRKIRTGRAFMLEM